MPPDPHVFFVDRSLGGKQVPGALAAHGWAIKAHDDVFPQNTPDTIWIKSVGAKGWIILTADDNLRYNPLEKAALNASGTWTFILAPRKNLRGVEMAQAFIKAERALLKAIAKYPPSSAFRVSADGKITKCSL